MIGICAFAVAPSAMGAAHLLKVAEHGVGKLGLLLTGAVGGQGSRYFSAIELENEGPNMHMLTEVVASALGSGVAARYEPARDGREPWPWIALDFLRTFSPIPLVIKRYSQLDLVYLALCFFSNGRPDPRVPSGSSMIF